MNDLLIYTAQVAIGLLLMYGIFWLFFRKDTFYKLNRFYLLSSVFLSLLIPLFNFSFSPPAESTTLTVMLDTVIISSERAGEIIRQNLSLYQGLLIAYLTGVAIFSLRFLFEMLQIILLIRKNRVSKRKNINIVHLKEKYAPFSFFGYIFINEKDGKKNELRKILDHELVHVRQNHSIDLIFIELLTILQWFNPVVWLYRRSVKETHEFLADEELINKGYDISGYQQALMHHAFGIQLNDMTNNFNYSILKRRIIMMTKQKTKSTAMLKYLLMLPLLGILLIGFACSNSDDEAVIENAQKSKAVENEAVIEQPAEEAESKQEEQAAEIFTVVEEMPEFPGGKGAFLKYLAENINYPESAKKDGVQGRVFVNFVVEKNGSISGVNVLRGVREDLDQEAIRVVSEMPKWKPGKQRGEAVRVSFNVPIKYQLD